MTKIEWAEKSWNPVVGCSKVSDGCRHCYAETIAMRFKHTPHKWTADHAAENVQLMPERLEAPLRRRKPTRYFVNSMSDLFHEQVPSEFIDEVFDVMARCPQHTFQILTKRPKRMRMWSMIKDSKMPGDPKLPGGYGAFNKEIWPLPNVWLGTSVEDQPTADERIPILLDTPAAVRFVSAEPLLAPVDMRRIGADHHPIGGACLDSLWNGIAWVIVGGESGPGARPCDIEWIRSIVRQCQGAGVPVFVKQDSGPRPGMQGRIPDDIWIKEYPR